MNKEILVDSTETNTTLNTSVLPGMATESNSNDNQTQADQTVSAASAVPATHAIEPVQNTASIQLTNSTYTETNDNNDFSPSMSELPSYNEALKLKKMEVNLENGEIPSSIPPSYYTSTTSNPNFNDETRIIIDPADLRVIAEATDQSLTEQEVGSECMFLSAFMVAFFFNWVGFFASICLLPNAAGKYGALSGLGLSIAKWVTMIKYQSWMTQMNDFQQKLFFWLFIFIGFYLFFRGLINFMSLKYRPRAHASYSRRMRDRWFGFID